MSQTINALTPTLNGKLLAANGRPAGFDYLRLGLSLMVIAAHAPLLSYGAGVDAEIWSSYAQGPIRLILCMFFALSGFLVAGSLERSRTLGYFLGLRVIRIFPALVVEVILSAFILGTLMTSLPLSDYFSDPLFRRYFMNMLGEPQFLLPGLFLNNPSPGLVNFQLWTVPYELICYIALSAVAWFNVRKRPAVVPISAVVVTVGYLIIRYMRNGGLAGLTPALSRPVPGPLLVICFLTGVSVYLYRERLTSNHKVGLAAGLLSVLFLGLPGFLQFVAPWPVAYFTAYVGTMNPRRIFVIAGADYSYGLYLYGYPMQQTIAHLEPWAHNALLNFAGAVTIASVFAAVSWRYIEKPALNLRRVLKAAEDWWLVRSPFARGSKTNARSPSLSARPPA